MLVNGLFRYPGGKGKLSDQILRTILAFYEKYPGLEYREPFIGGGSIGLRLLQNPVIQKAWLNDFDAGIIALWKSVNAFPEELCKAVRKFKPSTKAFYAFKKKLTATAKFSDDVEFGLAKLAIHQISYSGLGTMSGGPLGGRSQKSEYGIDCRWRPDLLCRKILALHHHFQSKKLRFTNCDFQKLTDTINLGEQPKIFLYLDPPYYEKGQELYQHGFTHDDHVRLAKSLKNTSQPWLLSYDDHPAIRELYDFAEMVKVPITYTINSARERHELLLAPKQYNWLVVENNETDYLFPELAKASL